MIALALFATAALPMPAPTWFVCDGIDAPVAYVATQPDAAGRIALTRIDKASGRRRTLAYTLGRADPGAGQVYHALIRAGREVGNIHLFNPGMAPSGVAATTPTVTGLTIGTARAECRWLGDTAFDGVTGRRGVNIARVNGRLVYRTFDFARPGPVVRPDGVQRMARPGLTIVGGTGLTTPAGGHEYRFAAGGWRYVVVVPGRGTAELRLLRGGRIVQRERFVGFVAGG